MAAERLPMLVGPKSDRDLVRWLVAHREEVERQLRDVGAILFRGFDVDGPEAFGAVVRALGNEPLTYRGAASPRTQVDSNVYTSTEFPPDRLVEQHSEQSYHRSFARKIWFMCEEPARAGGETPLSDNRRILARIPDDTRRQFVSNEVLYYRTFAAGPHDRELSISWQQGFQTESREEVESFLRTIGAAWQWLDNGRLHFSNRAQAVVRHPETNELVWFNQAHGFAFAAWGKTHLGEGADDWFRQHGRHEVSSDCELADGTRITEEMVGEINAAVDAETVAIPWCKGDVMLVDNILVSHGRRPFDGPRRVLAALTEPVAAEDLPAVGAV